MYISMIKHIRYSLCLIFTMMNMGNIIAQEYSVRPITLSTPNRVQKDLFAFISIGLPTKIGAYTAINRYDKNLYSNCFNIGAKTDFYFQKLKSIRVGPSLSYKNNHFSYQKGFFQSSGIQSHWLTADLNLSVWYMNVGVASDIFLSSKTTSPDHYSYVGIYSDCFNRASLYSYLGFNIRFTRFQIEGRMCFSHIPQLNPDKISQANLVSTTVDGLFYNIGISYRLFTTGKVHSAPSLFQY